MWPTCNSAHKVKPTMETDCTHQYKLKWPHVFLQREINLLVLIICKFSQRINLHYMYFSEIYSVVNQIKSVYVRPYFKMQIIELTLITNEWLRSCHNCRKCEKENWDGQLLRAKMSTNLNVELKFGLWVLIGLLGLVKRLIVAHFSNVLSQFDEKTPIICPPYDALPRPEFCLSIHACVEVKVTWFCLYVGFFKWESRWAF